MTTLNPSALRDRDSVQAEVDEILGDGMGITPLEAYQRLQGVQRVNWILAQFNHGVIHQRFHIWIQSHAQGDFDGPAFVARLGSVALEIDEDVGKLMLWTAERGRGVRAEERGEAIMGIVPQVWEPLGERAVATFRALIERWPAELEVEALPAPGPFERATVEPKAEGCRYPDCSVGYTKAATAACDVRAESAQHPVEPTLFALWQHGATDEELDLFAREAGDAKLRLPELLGEWVCFDGDGGDAERFAGMRGELDPVASILGIKTSVGQAIVRIQLERFEEMAAALKPYGAEAIRPDGEADFTQRTRAALRMGGAILLVRAPDLLDAEERDLLLKAIHVGFTVVLAGTSPEGDELVADVMGFGGSKESAT